MIRAEFFTFPGGEQAGFRIRGHSDAGAAGTDIVCAAVSSAAYLTANTVTDVIGAKAEVRAEDGFLECRILPRDAEACAPALKGLRLHLSALGQQYPETIDIIDTEV